MRALSHPALSAAGPLAAGLFGAVLLLGAVLLAPPRALGQARVEGVAALVGGGAPGAGTAVILRSDISLRARIALAGASERMPLGLLPEPLLAAALDEAIGEVLIAREADRLRAAQPTADEIERERARIEEQVGGAARLEELLRVSGADSAEVDAIARRRAYVGAFLHANLEGSATVSDAQLAQVYESEPHPFEGRELSLVREPLRAWIAQRALRRDVLRWIEVLRRRTPVRVLAEWQADSTEGAPAPPES